MWLFINKKVMQTASSSLWHSDEEALCIIQRQRIEHQIIIEMVQLNFHVDLNF
jgi:hypothetical protein